MVTVRAVVGAGGGEAGAVAAGALQLVVEGEWMEGDLPGGAGGGGWAGGWGDGTGGVGVVGGGGGVAGCYSTLAPPTQAPPKLPAGVGGAGKVSW